MNKKRLGKDSSSRGRSIDNRMDNGEKSFLTTENIFNLPTSVPTKAVAAKQFIYAD